MLVSEASDPEGRIHKTLTLGKAIALTFKISGRVQKLNSAAAGSRDPQNADLDKSSTASTMSGTDSDSDDVTEDSVNRKPADFPKRSVAWAQGLRTDVSSSSASHPLRSVEGRLATFANWNHGPAAMTSHSGAATATTVALSRALSPLALARQGFYRIMDPDSEFLVRCSHCRMEMAVTPDLPPPAVVHRRGSPSCPMVLGTAKESVGLSLKSSGGGNEETEEVVGGGDSCDISMPFQPQKPPEEGDLRRKANKIGITVLDPLPSLSTNQETGAAIEEDDTLSEPMTVGLRGPSAQVRDIYENRVLHQNQRRLAQAMAREKEGADLILTTKLQKLRTKLVLAPLGSSIALETSEPTGEDPRILRLAVSSVHLVKGGPEEIEDLHSEPEILKQTQKIENKGNPSTPFLRFTHWPNHVIEMPGKETFVKQIQAPRALSWEPSPLHNSTSFTQDIAFDSETSHSSTSTLFNRSLTWLDQELRASRPAAVGAARGSSGGGRRGGSEDKINVAHHQAAGQGAISASVGVIASAYRSKEGKMKSEKQPKDNYTVYSGAPHMLIPGK